MRCIKIILLLIYSLSLFGQQTVEEIENRMNEAQGEERLELMIMLGNALIKTDPDRSLEIGLNAAFLSKRMGNLFYEGRALVLMGQSSLTAGHHENALRYYNRALNHFEKTNILLGQIISLEGIAEIYNSVRNYDMAINYLSRALVISQDLDDFDLQVQLHIRIGDIALNQKNYPRAYNEFIKVQDILGNQEELSIDNLIVKVSSLRKIGYVYRSLGQFNESLASYRKAAEIGSSIGDKSFEMIDIQEIAFSFFLMQQLDSALFYYNQALAFYQLQNDSLAMIDILQNVGDVFFEKEQFRQAVASYNRSLDLALKKELVQEQVSALVKISRCFNEFGDYPSAKEYLNRALTISTRENLTNSAADVYRYLSQVSEEEGRYSQALEFYKLWADLRDSIYSEESGQKMARMQILYEISQKERENEILRQNSEIQELQLTQTRYQRMVFIVLALFLFALLVLFGFFYRSKQQEFIKQKETEQRIIEINKNLEKRMIAEIKKQEKQQLLLAQKSKLESLGTLAAGIAHEINQPLGGISMGLDNILIKLSEENFSAGYLKEKVNLLFENVDRIKKIIENTRTFSRAHKPASFERVDLNIVVTKSIQMIENQYKNHDVSLRVNLNPGLEFVVADFIKLEQVVLNLLSNAKDAVDEKQRFLNRNDYTKTIEVSSWQEGENVCISVRDNGVGIKKNDLEKIFDPFYTTKKEDKGTGLGLSISYGFIKDLMGEIVVDSKEGEFTIFDIKLPKS